MTFDYPGYNLEFIQKQPCNDATDHLFTIKFRFYSPVTKYTYVLHADYHKQDVFAIKFYCKKDKKSDFKYSKIVNRGDCGNILITCARVVPLLLKEYPTASFGFGAARSVDNNNNTVEPYSTNQRFLLYRYIAMQKFGRITFTHFEYPVISCYLLVNKTKEAVEEKEPLIKKMFAGTYPSLPDV